MHLNISFYLVDYASLYSRNRMQCIFFQPSSKEMSLLPDPKVAPNKLCLNNACVGSNIAWCINRGNVQYAII